jgi:hypothetical protein
MNAPIDLKEMERKAFQSFYQDGIWDLFFGLMMFAMYTFTLFDSIENKALRILGMLFIEIFAVFFLIYGKKMITAPRLGQVVFGKKRKRNMVYIFLTNLASVIFLVAWFAYRTAHPSFFDERIVSAVGMGIWITFLTSIMAYFLDFNRLYVYALIYGATFAAVLLLDWPILFLVASLLILVPGGVIFYQFLKTTEPIQEK